MPKPKYLFDDQSAPPLSPKEVAANAAAWKVQQATLAPAKAVKSEKKAASSSVTIIPGKRAGGMVRGDGCASKGKTKGRCR